MSDTKKAHTFIAVRVAKLAKEYLQRSQRKWKATVRYLRARLDNFSLMCVCGTIKMTSPYAQSGNYFSGTNTQLVPPIETTL